MKTLAKAEIVYTEETGGTLISEFEDEHGLNEILLASMLVETIAVRQGLTVEETVDTLADCISENDPMRFNITRERLDEALDEDWSEG